MLNSHTRPPETPRTLYYVISSELVFVCNKLGCGQNLAYILFDTRALVSIHFKKNSALCFAVALWCSKFSPSTEVQNYLIYGHCSIHEQHRPT